MIKKQPQKEFILIDKKTSPKANSLIISGIILALISAGLLAFIIKTKIL